MMICYIFFLFGGGGRRSGGGGAAVGVFVATIGTIFYCCCFNLTLGYMLQHKKKINPVEWKVCRTVVINNYYVSPSKKKK
eukprot:11620757-Ditylum_brightwellii.AAC.1